MTRYQKTIQWNLICGNPIDDTRARTLCTAEWDEFHEATGEAKLFEIGDVLFTASWFEYCLKQKGLTYPSYYTEAKRLVNELGAWAYVDAVIESNYSKLLSINDYTTLEASQMACDVAELYKGRYTGVVVRRVGEYYIVLDDKGKVLKPTCFKEAKHYLSHS